MVLNWQPQKWRKNSETGWDQQLKCHYRVLGKTLVLGIAFIGDLANKLIKNVI